jgi:hypothetical protein
MTGSVQVRILQMTEHQKLPNLIYFGRNFHGKAEFGIQS